jgi:SnoaL-like domain
MSDTQQIPRRSFLGQVRTLVLAALGTTTVRAATAMPESNKAESMTPSPASDAPLYSREFMAFRNRTLEQKVQELTDREEIRELIARYAHRVAHGESNADLFTDNGVFIVRIPGRPVQETGGREKINKMYKEAGNRPGHSLPMIHNYLISISDDEATGLCSNELRTTENGRSIIASGYYEDKYRRENGRWRFAMRDASFFHWIPIQDGWTELKK